MERQRKKEIEGRMERKGKKEKYGRMGKKDRKNRMEKGMGRRKLICKGSKERNAEGKKDVKNNER